MSTPISDDDKSEQLRKYAPKRLREQPGNPARSSSPLVSPSHAQAQDDRHEALPSIVRGLENEVRRPLYEAEAESQPKLRRRRYSVLEWISAIAIITACMAA